MNAESLDRPCAIRDDGTVVLWTPMGEEVQPLVYDYPGDYTQIGADGRCAIRSDGTIACWEEDAPAGTYSKLSVAEKHVCAIDKSDGALVCWGDNEYQQATVPPDL